MGLLKGPKRVLIVDGAPALATEVKRAIWPNRVEVVTAGSIEAAEEAVNRYHFDLVIADITMSGILGTEGLELISFIKSHRPEARVIITSAHASEALKRDAFKRGADGFQTKPIDIQELAVRLEEMGLRAKQKVR